jgi:imidazole glycerol-phosphate synthase subunit HisF
MLKTRVIPTLLWKDTTLVKGVGFDSWRRVGTMIPAIKVYNTRQVDELIVLDISATRNDRDPDYRMINEFAAECFVPLTVGGGVNSVDIIKKLLRSGADKVSVNSAIYDNPEIVEHGVKKFGKQCIVASIDVKKRGDDYICYSHSGSTCTHKELIEVVREVYELGVGEILITSIEQDGTMKGYDVDLIRAVSESVDIPVIASGGAGNYEHMHQALVQGKAAAVAAASIFHFTEQTPLEAKSYLKTRGIPVRD